MQLLPPLPTDNLYKFMAIAGLVVVIISAIYPPLLTREATELAAEVQVAHDRVERDVEQLKREAADLEQATKKARANPDHLNDAYLVQLDEDRARLDAKLEETDDRLDAFQIHGEKSLARVLAAQAQMEMISKMFWPSSFLMFVGFLAWYCRVQRHADRILRLQAEAAEREAKVAQKAHGEPTAE